jgi:hypothetical protein
MNVGDGGANPSGYREDKPIKAPLRLWLNGPMDNHGVRLGPIEPFNQVTLVQPSKGPKGLMGKFSVLPAPHAPQGTRPLADTLTSSSGRALEA